MIDELSGDVRFYIDCSIEIQAQIDVFKEMKDRLDNLREKLQRLYGGDDSLDDVMDEEIDELESEISTRERMLIRQHPVEQYGDIEKYLVPRNKGKKRATPRNNTNKNKKRKN